MSLFHPCLQEISKKHTSTKLKYKEKFDLQQMEFDSQVGLWLLSLILSYTLRTKQSKN